MGEPAKLEYVWRKIGKSDKVLEVLLKLFAGEEDTALHCAKRQVQFFGYLAVLEPCYMHGEGELVLAWQRVDDAVHFLQVVGGFGAFEGCVAR